MTEPKNVTEALARIMGELPAIAKKRHPGDNVNYAYRGIEEITAEAQELCAKYGVVYYPRAEITEIKDIVVNGKPWTDTVALVEYEIVHGPSDTSRFVRVPAIGRDNSDKGSNKAMTQAFKYALIQTLMIADPKDDGDRERHETDARRPSQRNGAPQGRAEAPAAVRSGTTEEAAAPSPPSVALTASADVSTMGLRELTEALQAAGLSLAGNTEAKRQRLAEHLAAPQADPETGEMYAEHSQEAFA